MVTSNLTLIGVYRVGHLGQELMIKTSSRGLVGRGGEQHTRARNLQRSNEPVHKVRVCIVRRQKCKIKYIFTVKSSHYVFLA